MQTHHIDVQALDCALPVVTGGYDHQLIHFDFSQGSVLSKSDFGMQSFLFPTLPRMHNHQEESSFNRFPDIS
jgi:hypothetical protein